MVPYWQMTHHLKDVFWGLESKLLKLTSNPYRSSKIPIQVALDTALEIALTLKLRIRPLIIEASNFQGNSRTPNTNSILKVHRLVLKISLEKFSSL